MKKELEEIQRLLNDVVAKLNETPKFEVGRWYINNRFPNLLVNYQGEGCHYGFGSGGWTNKYLEDTWIYSTTSNSKNTYKKATGSEVGNALFNEYKRLGFKDGVAFKGVKGANKNITITIGKNDSTKFLFDEDGPNTGLYCGNSWIFWGGQWATPIKEEPLMIGWHEVIIHPRAQEISINGIIYTKEFLLNAQKVLQPDQIESINVGCTGQYKVDSYLINKILDRMK